MFDVGVFSSDWLSGELVTVEDDVGVDEGRWVEVGAEVEVAVGAAVSDVGGSICVGEVAVDPALPFVVVTVDGVPVVAVVTEEVLLSVPDIPPRQPARRTITTITRGTRAVIRTIVGNHEKDVFDSDSICRRTIQSLYIM